MVNALYRELQAIAADYKKWSRRRERQRNDDAVERAAKRKSCGTPRSSARKISKHYPFPGHWPLTPTPEKEKGAPKKRTPPSPRPPKKQQMRTDFVDKLLNESTTMTIPEIRAFTDDFEEREALYAMSKLSPEKRAKIQRTAAAATKVFETVELCEKVLLEMPVRAALKARRINSKVCAIFLGSTKLHQQAFLEPSKKFRKVEGQGADKKIVTLNNNFFRLAAPPQGLTTQQRFGHSWIRAKRPVRAFGTNGLWRDDAALPMLLTQPPIKKVQVYLEFRDRGVQMLKTFVVDCKEGLHAEAVTRAIRIKKRDPRHGKFKTYWVRVEDDVKVVEDWMDEGEDVEYHDERFDQFII